MAKIFISYRREDAGFAVDQVHAALKPYAETPSDIFIDVDNIPPGVDFVEHLESKVSQCEIMLVAIGLRWLDSINESGAQRLNDPDDFVRIEIESALARGIPVVPVLVGGASMPQASELPESLQPLVRRQAVKIERGHVQQAVDDMMKRMGLKKAGAATLANSSEVRRIGRYAAFAVLLIGVVGVLLWQSGGISARVASDASTSGDVPEHIAKLRNGCIRVSLRDCAVLGYAYEKGNGMPVDYAEAVQLYQKACHGGDALGCNNLGYYHEIGRVVEKDRAEAVRLYQFACNEKLELGCDNLEYLNQPNVEPEEIRNARRECFNEKMEACVTLGYAYEQGKLVSKDFEKAVQYYRTACDGQNPMGCNNLGYYYQQGRIVEKDLAQAARLFEFACKADVQKGCGNLEILNGNQ